VDGVETEITPIALEPCRQSLFISSAVSLNYEHLEEAAKCDNYLAEGSLAETYRSMLKIKLSTIDDDIQSATSEKIVVADSKVLIDESDIAVPVIVVCEDLLQDVDVVKSVITSTVVEPFRQSMSMSSAA